MIEPPLVVEQPQLSSIQSAGTMTMNSAGLGEMRRLLEVANHEVVQIHRELDIATKEETVSNERYTQWRDGWLFRRLFTSTFLKIEAKAQETTERRTELAEQLKLARLRTQVEAPAEVIEAFHRMCDDFSRMAGASKIWDTVGERAANRVVERTTAGRIVDRKEVRFGLGNCDVIESEWNVPHLGNANGGDIYLYPLFVLYFVSSESFALLEYKDISLGATATRFIEEEGVPTDSQVVGQTWAKANKDGSPDRRFKDNYQIPVALYGKLVFKSATGMQEEYMISNTEWAEAFARSWQRLAQSVTKAGG